MDSNNQSHILPGVGSTPDAGAEQRHDAARGRGMSAPAPSLITEDIVRAAHASGEVVVRAARGAIVTPLAQDALRSFGMALASALPGETTSQSEEMTKPRTSRKQRDRVAIGVVPNARELETTLASFLRENDLVPFRVPTHIRSGSHLARQVAGAVSSGQASWGVVVEETGIISAAVANRAPGVIAASCSEILTVGWARERLGANILCVSSDLVAPTLFSELLRIWITTPLGQALEVSQVLEEVDRRTHAIG
jgi:ribose 5-phosphate isomerase RpiB